jgi:hypothetical protein
MVKSVKVFAEVKWGSLSFSTKVNKHRDDKDTENSNQRGRVVESPGTVCPEVYALDLHMSLSLCFRSLYRLSAERP